MATRAEENARTGLLGVLGISDQEELVYRWLLLNSGATSQQVAKALQLPSAKTQRLLDTIEMKGLATHSPERPRRYIPASPDMGLEVLALKHQEDLKRARGAIQDLREQLAAQRHSDPEPMVELITNGTANRQALEQVIRSAQREIVSLVRPPMLISELDTPPEQHHASQRAAISRDVRLRSINDADYLALPGAVSSLRADMAAGEEARVYPQLPFKMVLADRRVALIPLDVQQSSSQVLLVRSAALGEALFVLFEMLWERAVSIASCSEEELHVQARESSDGAEMREFLPLLAAGLNDKAVAVELGISMRTLRRKVNQLMQDLQARTRFQAGWTAALRSAKK